MINRDSKKMEELQMQYVCVRVFHFSDYLVFKQDSRPIEIEQPTRITYTRYQETKQIQQPIKQDDKKVVEIEEQEEPKEEPKEKQIINEEENTIKITEDDNS